MPVKLCTHIFPDAHRCGSPALRGATLCYYHHPDRKPVADTHTRRTRSGFYIPPITDRATLQRVLSEIISRLGANTIDVHRARLILYTLQIAANSMP